MINVSERPKEPTWAEKAETKRRLYFEAAVALLKQMEEGSTSFARPMEPGEIKSVLDIANQLLCDVPVK